MEWRAGWDACRVEYPRTAPPSAPVELRNAILDALNLVHAEGRARVESATAEMADRLAALAQQPAASHCSDERPCVPCFSDCGPCEDAPAAVDEVKIDMALAERVMDALGRFTSDEGWSAADMMTADAFGAAIATQHQEPES